MNNIEAYCLYCKDKVLAKNVTVIQERIKSKLVSGNCTECDNTVLRIVGNDIK